MTGAAGPDMPDYGLGTAGLGNLYTEISNADAQGALQAALEAGLRYIDTAPFYGHGLSEQRVGAFLQASDANPVISTKVGRQLRPAGTQPIPDNGFASPAPFIPEFDYSAEGVRASFADSQKRLGVRSVDILLLHDIGEATHGAAHQEVFDQAVTEAL
ncbi:MAG: aldo/keto reductase, partial [Hyphomonadaceae bacterium]|nr:aldo/keto reductase [Hyphomonadaceae bacterium]